MEMPQPPMISNLPLLSLALVTPLAPLLRAEDIDKNSPVYELSSGVVATGDFTAEQSSLRFESGDMALR